MELVSSEGINIWEVAKESSGKFNAGWLNRFLSEDKDHWVLIQLEADYNLIYWPSESSQSIVIGIVKRNSIMFNRQHLISRLELKLMKQLMHTLPQPHGVGSVDAGLNKLIYSDRTCLTGWNHFYRLLVGNYLSFWTGPTLLIFYPGKPKRNCCMLF